jgi:hypothetical protein
MKEGKIEESSAGEKNPYPEIAAINPSIPPSSSVISVARLRASVVAFHPDSFRGGKQ